MNKLGNWLDGHTQHTGCSLQNVIKQNPQPDLHLLEGSFETAAFWMLFIGVLDQFLTTHTGNRRNYSLEAHLN